MIGPIEIHCSGASYLMDQEAAFRLVDADISVRLSDTVYKMEVMTF